MKIRYIEASTMTGIFHHCLEVSSESGGYIPRRFTRKQYEVYKEQEMYQIRSRMPAGVKMSFCTNTCFVRFQYKVVKKIQNWCYFDVFVDGIHMDSVGTHSVELGEHVFEYFFLPFNEQEREVWIYLPYTVELIIAPLEIERNALFRLVTPHTRKMLCLGDSITQGNASLYPSYTYPSILSREMQVDVLNQGVGGYVFNEASLDIQTGDDFDLVTAAFGTNDWNKGDSLETIGKNCLLYIEKLNNLYPSADIFVITPLWRSSFMENKPTGTLLDVIQMIQGVCILYPRIHVINGMRLVPHMEAFFLDGLHPNVVGVQQYGFHLVQEMRKVLK